MGEQCDFSKMQNNLDDKLALNHKIHNVLYKFKGLNSNIDITNNISFARIIDIIENHSIYIPTKSEVNDPFEGEIIHTHYGIMGSFIHLAKNELPPVAISDLEQYRFLSLSSKANRPQMWAYYANEFKGLCFVYNTKDSFKNYEDILYLNEKEREDICETLENPDQDQRKLIARYNLLLKSDDWIKEDEVRIIVDEKEKFINYKPDELIAIILGHRMDEKCKEKIIEVARKNNIEVYYTYLNSLKLKIDILPYEFDVNKATSGGEPYDKALEKWRNTDEHKNKYSLSVNGDISNLK